MTRDCIVVTGASRGIGAGIALALAQQGLHVACLSRSGALPPFSDVSPDVSARWLPRTADVMRPDDLKTVLGALAQEGWRIVGLVNNAGLHIAAHTIFTAELQAVEIRTHVANGIVDAHRIRAVVDIPRVHRGRAAD